LNAVDATHRFRLQAAILAPGETPARNASQLTRPQRAAIIACAIAGRLHRFFQAWHGDGDGAPIDARTVETLRKSGLMAVAGRNARLTDNGKWYARTLCSAIAGELHTEGKGEP
jgi:hypothetical protein